MNAKTSPPPVRLKPAVRNDGSALSKAARREIAAMSGPRSARFLRELLLCWAVIAVAIGGAEWLNHWAATVLAVVVVASRQMVLGLLLHEQVHRLGLRGRWGDTLVNLLAVYPLVATTVEDYAAVHLRHHRWPMTPQDPDFLRKQGPDWTFPMPARRLLGLLLRDQGQGQATPWQGPVRG